MNTEHFQYDLLNWYSKNKRDLPWRKTTNPYHIWISEIMLQQTQVNTVIPYYENFIQTFPKIEDLANAPIENVYKCWEGLGYYSRARNLQEAAKKVVDKYNGIFPHTYEDLLTLKGIGPYTASAIASIAFGIPKGVVDGNVLRILSRMDCNDANIALEGTKKAYQKRCDMLISKKDPASFNQALMDLGATICKPKQPQCQICPIQKYCLAFKNNKQNILPINIKKIKNKDINYLTCFIEYEGKYLVIKNESGLLDGLYALVQFDVDSPSTFEEKFKEIYEHEIQLIEFLKETKHVFSHRTWRMQVYKARFINQPNLPLYTLKEINELPMATAHKKLFQLL